MPVGNFPTPLRRAIRDHDLERVRAVLDRAGDKEKAAKLINHDHSPDCMFRCCSSVQGNALYYAIKYRHEEPIVALLLDYGADLHATGEFGETCLHAAARYNYFNTCKLLLQKGADLYATDDHGRCAIHRTGQSFYDTSKTIKYLLEVGKPEDVNLKDFTNRTALHEAVYCDNCAVIETLIQCGADVNATSNAGYTPLHMTKKDSYAWQMLVKSGADTTIKNNKGELPGEAV